MKNVVSLVLLAAVHAGVPAAPASPAAPAVPAIVADAGQLAALPGGAWLALDKRGLRLVGADGRERASLAMRAEQLDLRLAEGGALAVVIDSNAERVQPVRVDLRQGALTALPPLPEAGFGIEAACMYRDAQQLDHVFVVGKDGQAQQWLLGGDYRAYALPYVAAAAKAGALNRVPATTRAELAAGLAHAAARGDGDAGYASKLLGRVGLLAT